MSGILGGNAASKAAKQQAQAQQAAIDYTKGQVGEAKSGIAEAGAGVAGAAATGQASVAGGVADANSRLQPYSDAGTSSVGLLQTLAGKGGPLDKTFSFDPSNLAQDPGYKFTLDQGQQAIQRAAAAQGGLFSGGTLKSLAGYTTGSANQYFNDAFTRAQSTFNTNQQAALNRVGTLQNMAGLGYGASTTQSGNTLGGSEFGANLGMTGSQLGLQGAEASGQLGVQGAGAIANMMGKQGDALAAGTVGSANSWLGALQGGTNSIIGYLNTPKASTPGSGQQIGTLDRNIATSSGALPQMMGYNTGY